MTASLSPPAVSLRKLAHCLAVALAMHTLLGWGAARAEDFLDRPIYRDRQTGFQLPPGCSIQPPWRVSFRESPLEIWVAHCNDGSHVWLLDVRVLERESGAPVRWRYQILDDRPLPKEIAGDSASVQCTDLASGLPAAVIGAQWQSDGKTLVLGRARAALRTDLSARRLVEGSVAGLECVRFPERENILQKLQAPARQKP